ncbi:hypothetical protein [Spirosoma oryzicola]|uniref:hypothetical protein n=1 Tax=Spirosoma oryzicola TaxID=2898794 RepID=UPI0031344873
MMYSVLLFLHSCWRWLVLISLVYAIYSAYTGFYRRQVFTTAINSLRHWTATIAHIQLLLGMALYVQSPVVKLSMGDNPDKWINEQLFFRYVHLAMMLVAVVLITIGSAKAKRAKDDAEKYRTMLTWFSWGLVILLMAIPWPFSPLANRPYIRSF